MATTNMPRDAVDDRRSYGDEKEYQDNQNAAGNEHGDDIDDLHQQALDAIESRVMANNVNIRDGIRDKHMAVYEGAIKRRGRRQAAMDQLQGAVGLPMDPQLRQNEVERRIDTGNAAMTAQSGTSTMQDHLDGTAPTSNSRMDEYAGDQRLAEFNPHVQQGHGANVASQVIAAQALREVAPNAPLTPENVADPEGAADRHPAKENDPDGKPATGGTPQNESAEDRMVREQRERADALARPKDQQRPADPAALAGNVGLTEEQIRRREQLASGAERE